MRIYFILSLLLFSSSLYSQTNNKMLQRLDSIIELRKKYTDEKVTNIDKIKYFPNIIL